MDKVNSLYFEQSDGNMLSLHEDTQRDRVVIVVSDIHSQVSLILDYDEADQLYAWLQEYINRAP